MAAIRKPLQGITNIVRFNRHFYVLAILLATSICVAAGYISDAYKTAAYIACALITLTTLISMAVSFYVYDVSFLYSLNWLNELSLPQNPAIANINAGFDETTALLEEKFHPHHLAVFDFYNPLTHTEISIKRARKAYPPYNGTIPINTTALPVQANYFDAIFLIFAAHEIRQDDERIQFFTEIKRTLKPGGVVVLTEHLRDLPNFLAYNIGLFHFLTKASWHNTVKQAGLVISKQKKLNPFVTTFFITKHAATT